MWLDISISIMWTISIPRYRQFSRARRLPGFTAIVMQLSLKRNPVRMGATMSQAPPAANNHRQWRFNLPTPRPYATSKTTTNTTMNFVASGHRFMKPENASWLVGSSNHKLLRLKSPSFSISNCISHNLETECFNPHLHSGEHGRQ